MQRRLIPGLVVFLMLIGDCFGIYRRQEYPPSSLQIKPDIIDGSENTFLDDPLKHHIDFDEFHPGEDLIAEESISYPAQHDGYNRRARTFNDHAKQHTDPLSIYFGSRNLNEMFQLPSFNGFLNVPTPWWKKGNNVCESLVEEEGDTPANDSSDIEDKDSLNSASNFAIPNFHVQHTRCEEKDDTYSCIKIILGPNVNKTITTEYECCQGYILNKGRTACERGTLKSVLATMTEIGGNEFAKLVEKVGLENKISTQNITVFLPTDEAILTFLKSNPVTTNEIIVSLEHEIIRRRRSLFDYEENIVPADMHFDYADIDISTDDIVKENIHNKMKEDWKRAELKRQQSWNDQQRLLQQSHYESLSNVDDEMNTYDLQQLLLGHLISGKLNTDDFVNEKVLYTEANNKGTIRLNNYFNVGTTVNCVPVISSNHRCLNGMIQMIDKVLQPATKSIAEVIESTSELSLLQSFVSNGGILSMLQDSNEHLTFLAPSNAAFNKLEPNILQKLRTGDPCLKRILNNHILPFTFCSNAMARSGQMRNINHRPLDFQRTRDDRILINNFKLKTRDIVTTNGVIHIIDGVLLFDDDVPLTNALQKNHFSKFLELCSEAGIKHTLDELQNITVFAPVNNAFEELPNGIRQNPTKLRELLSYHIGMPEIMPVNFRHGEKLSTRLTSQFIRIHLQPNFPFPLSVEATAQCGLIQASYPSCNGIIYKVDRILIPPEKNILQTLRTQADMKVFVRLIQEANFTHILEDDSLKTVFAPKDSVFYSLPSETFQQILGDPIKIKQIVEAHIIEEEYICCTGIGPRNWMLTKRVRNMYGHSIPLWRGLTGEVNYGNAKVTSCDLTASNGVIHVVDALLEAQQVYRPNEFKGSCFPLLGQEDDDDNNSFSLIF